MFNIIYNLKHVLFVTLTGRVHCNKKKLCYNKQVNKYVYRKEVDLCELLNMQF